jgi:integrase
LLILTGQRRGEVAGMTWAELSDDLTTWTLPGDRTKNGVTHTVPLSAPARDILSRLVAKDAGKQRSGELVFPGAAATPFAGWSKSKRALDQAITDARAKTAAGQPPAGVIPWNVHDLRRTVATSLQRLGIRLEVTEAVLNHISGSRGGIAGVYQRHDWAAEKRAALDTWSAHVISVDKGRVKGANVVRMPLNRD